MQKFPLMSEIDYYPRQVFNKCESCILINVIEIAAGTFSDIMVAPHSGIYRNVQIALCHLTVVKLLQNIREI
jgi:hypothetical protein